MDNDAIIDMEADTACQGKSLTVASEASHLGRCVKVFDRDHLLMDDRACIQLRSCVVAGGADQFHAPIVGTTVGIGPGKGRQQGVVDIDDAVVMLLTEPSGKDLHVATEDRKFTRNITDGIAHLSKGRFFSRFISRNRNMEKRKPLLLHRGTQSIVIRDHERHLDVHFFGAPAPDQVCQTVVLFTHEQHGSQRFGAVPDRPTGIDAHGNRRECSSHRFKGDALRHLKGKAGEEPIVDRVRVLVHLDEVAPLLGNKACDLG